MQSFQDFIQSRRRKSADDEDLDVLRRSRSEHASEVPAAGPQLQRTASKTSLGNLASSLPSQNSFEAAAAGAHAAEAAAAVHTTTTVNGAANAAAAAAGGSRYLSRSSTAAGSSRRLSDGLSSTLQQLLSPQRSAALNPLSNSSSLRASNAAAGATAADLHAAALAAATMAGGQQGQLARVTSSRSAGQIGSGSFSRLQPLSIADALQSPLSRSTAATPPGAHTPTGARMPIGGRRCPAAAAPVAGAGGDDAAAVGGVRSPEFTVGHVLQDAAMRAAALNRSTTIKSQASEAALQPHAGLQASTASSLQQLLSQQHSQQEPQQEQQHLPGGQPPLQQQQHPGQQWLQPEQQQHGNAAALLNDLDRRFANIKDGLRGVFSLQDSIQQRCADAGAGDRPVAAVGAAAAAGGLPMGAAAGTAAAADYGLFRGSSDGRAAKYPHVMTEPYSLDEESSDGGSSIEGSPRQSPHQAQQQQSLLSPMDSSSVGDSSDEEEQSLGAWRQQQQQEARHRAGQPPLLHHHPKGGGSTAEVTLDGCVAAAAAAGRQQGRPAVIATAAAAAAAATAAAADGSLPIEVDVKCGEECGEEGELRGATAHFIVSHVMSPDAAGSRHTQQHQQHQHHSRRQLQLPQEPSLPSTVNMLGAEQSGGSLSLPATSPAGTAPDWDSQHSSASLAAAAAAGAPQPRSVKPRPSLCQRHQQQHGLRGPAAGKAAAGAACGEGRSAAAAAVAAAGAGVLDGGEGDRWCSNALILAKQQAKELQQQNDALVRVLERERQQHTKTRQQVSELRADLQEVQAEWEVKLQTLRQEKLAAEAQLRRALAGSEQQEMLTACDAALAASAARAEEAQAAASRLATQVTELELQVQQLQLICGTTAAGGAAEGGGSSGAAAAKPSWRPLSGSSSSGGGGSIRADGAAAMRAVASAECRSPEKRVSARCRAAFTPGAAPDGCGGRGVRALRQHQAHLEAQLAKLSEELSQLQRENVKLLRYKKQYEVAAASLASAGGAKAAAESYAQEAGLRAAAAGGRADKLELQVEELQQQVQQLKAERDRAQLHLQIAQQQQRLHASMSAGAANNSGGGSSTLPLGAGAEQFSGSSFLSAAALAGTGGSSAWEAAFGSMGAAAGAPAPDTASAVQLACGQPGSAVTSMQLQHQAAGLSPAAALAAAALGAGAACAVASSPAQPAAAVSAAEQEAMAAVQQLKTSLPDALPVQGQLASLMSAIQAGVQERQVLAAQGRVLLDMLVGSN